MVILAPDTRLVHRGEACAARIERQTKRASNVQYMGAALRKINAD
jgi:hypothetical protein